MVERGQISRVLLLFHLALAAALLLFTSGSSGRQLATGQRQGAQGPRTEGRGMMIHQPWHATLDSAKRRRMRCWLLMAKQDKDNAGHRPATSRFQRACVQSCFLKSSEEQRCDVLG